MTELRIPITAGILVRGAFRRAIEAGAFEAGLECEVTERRSLLESLYLFRLYGDATRLNQFEDWVRALVKANA